LAVVLDKYGNIAEIIRHYTISSRFPWFHYRFVTSLLCSRLRLSLPLFLTSLYYLIKVYILSLSVCYVTALFYASTVSSFVSYVTILFLQGLSRIVSFSVCYITILSLQDLHCFIICLLRHYTISSRFPLFQYLLHNYSVLGFDCRLFLCWLRHYLFRLFV